MQAVMVEKVRTDSGEYRDNSFLSEMLYMAKNKPVNSTKKSPKSLAVSMLIPLREPFVATITEPIKAIEMPINCFFVIRSFKTKKLRIAKNTGVIAARMEASVTPAHLNP